MATKSRLTADEAWQPFEPTDASPFDRKAAAHLFRRAGFAANLRQLDEAVHSGISKTVKRLTDVDGHAAFETGIAKFAQSVLAGNNPEAISSWWLYRMRHSPSPLLEKMTLFWHGRFATSAAKVTSAKLVLRQNELLRANALGGFRRLLQGIARDPAMLLYLDSATNRKTHPNENFAREVMELFTLGPGHYTERDIQQLARCFTGWEVQHGEFKFHTFQHDYGIKHLLGKQGAWDGDAAIEVLLQQPRTAEFLCEKLIRFLVADELENLDEYARPLAKQLRESDYDFAPVVSTILSSKLFFSPELRGAKVRSPIELSIGLLRSLDATANLNQLVDQLQNVGQVPLYPPNVKGWNGGREWINASTIVARANLVRQLVESSEVRFGGETLEAYLKANRVTSDDEIVDAFVDLLAAVSPPEAVHKELIASLGASHEPREGRLRALVHTIGSLPESQLS